MPALVAMDAAKNRGDFRLSREHPVGLQQCGEDQANRGIKGGNRSKVEPDFGLRDAMIEAEKGAAQLPVRRGRRQRGAHPAQQPLMDQLFICDACKPTASSILQRRTPEMREGQHRRFLPAGKALQELGKRLGLHISEPKRSHR